MIRKQEIKKKALLLIQYEQACQRGEDVSENMSAMEKLISGLSPEELFAIDDYIMVNKKNLLT